MKFPTSRYPVWIIVPPKTKLPVNLLTGTDSPVMALSSTDAFPFITSPSRGILSPAHMIINVPIGTFFAGIDSFVSANTAISSVVCSKP